MKKILALVLFVCFCIPLFAQTNNTGELQDVVYLKNGGKIKGIIVEQVPNVSLKIETQDGSIFVFKIEEIEKITRERSQSNVYQNKNQSYANEAGFKRRDPGLAFLFSFLLPGGGQYYNGEYGKGALMTSLAVGSLIGMAATAPTYDYYYSNGSYYEDNSSSAAQAFFIMLYLGTEIWTMVDAPVRANKLNKSRGLVNWNINKNMNLSMNPDMQFSAINMRPTTTYGLKLSLSLR